MTLTFELVFAVVITVVAGLLAWLYLRKNSSGLEQDAKENVEGSETVKDLTEDAADNERRLPQIKEEESNIREEEIDDLLIKLSDLKSVNEDSTRIFEEHIKEEGFANLQSYYKSSRLHLKEMESEMTQEEKEQEREAQRKQLEKIFELMERQKDKFGVNSLDDVQEQMKLYAQK